MTVVVGYLDNDIPCLLGDIMISSTIPPNKNVTLPVSGQQSVDTPIRWDTHYFTDFQQKLNSIGPHMMIGWAGSLIEAKTAIKAIRKKYNEIDPTDFEQLSSVLLCVDNLGLKDVSLIAVIANDDRWSLKHFGSASKKFITPWGENAVAAGTGEDFIMETLEIESSFTSEDKWNKSYSRLITTAARMWFYDISGIGPQLAFGGGYELAIRQNNRITKITDILYVNHVYRPEEGIGLVPIFKKVDYWNDFLVIRILDFSDPPATPNADAEYKRSAVYLIPPVDHNWNNSPQPSKEEVLAEIPDMNASHFATHIRVNTTQPDIDPHCVTLQEYRTTDKPITFRYEGEGLLPTYFHLNSRYCEQIVDAVKAVLEKAGEPFQ